MTSTAPSHSLMPPGPMTATPLPDFDLVLSKDLEAYDVATNHLKRSWRALSPLARRHPSARALVLAIAALMGDVATSRREIKERAAR